MAGSFSHISFSSTSFSTDTVVPPGPTPSPPDLVNFGGGGGQGLRRKGRVARGKKAEKARAEAVTRTQNDEALVLGLALILDYYDA